MKSYCLTAPLFAALLACAGGVQAAGAEVVPKGAATEAPKADARKADTKKADTKKADAKKADARKPDGKSSVAASTLVDINTAGKSQLKMLPGVDDRLADQIIRGRPYKVKAELVTRRIVSQDAYTAFSGLIVAKPL